MQMTLGTTIRHACLKIIKTKPVGSRDVMLTAHGGVAVVGGTTR